MCADFPDSQPPQPATMAARAALITELEQELLAALKDALEDLEFWSGYASDYFKEKHDLAGSLDRLRAAIAKAEGRT